MKLSTGIFGLMLVAAMTVSHPAMAKEKKAQTSAMKIVSVGGQTLFTLKADSAGKSVDDRANAVYDRLPKILSDRHLVASDIRLVRNPDKTVAVTVDNRLLVTVTPEDGAVNQLSTLDQAKIWRNELRRNLPSVSLWHP